MNVEREPAEAGFDAQRLARIDRHFQRYVDDGKLPGFLAVVARDGRGRARGAEPGCATSRPDLPVETDTLWRIYSMTKPITSVAAMLLWEEGAFELKDPVARFVRVLRRHARVARRQPRQAGDRARDRADPDVAPAHPHGGPHVRLPLRAPGRRDVPRRTGSSGARRRASTSPRAATRGRSCRCSSSPAASGTTRVATDVLGRVDRGDLRADARRVLRGADLRSAGHDRHGLRRVGPGAAGRALHARPDP